MPAATTGAPLVYTIRSKAGGGKFPRQSEHQLGSGVVARYGAKPGGASSLIDVRFSRGAWTGAKARAWLAEHDETAIATLARPAGKVWVRIHETARPFAEGAKPVINREAGTISNAKICGWDSENGRDYRPALKAAVSLYEGAPVNSNHPEPGSATAWESRLGAVRSPRMEADGLHGDLVLNPKHRDMDQLFWFAEHMPEAIALSHRINAFGRVRSDGVFEVEKIDRVFAVEVVADGGTNRSLYESAADEFDDTKGAGDAMDIAHLTLAELMEGNPGIVQALRDQIAGEGEAKKLKEDLAAAQAEAKALKAKLDEHAAKEAAAADVADSKTLCEKAEMPQTAISDAFLATLAGKTAEQKRELIEDRMALIREAGARPTSKASDVRRMAGEGDASARPDLKKLVESAKSAEDFERLLLT